MTEPPNNPVSVGKFVSRFPGVAWASSDTTESGDDWWVKFQLDIKHANAWRIVQALGYVLNQISLNDPLPTKFYPVSAPPDMNGGPEQCLFWVIEPQGLGVDASEILAALDNTLLFDTENEEEWAEWTSGGEAADD